MTGRSREMAIEMSVCSGSDPTVAGGVRWAFVKMDQEQEGFDRCLEGIILVYGPLGLYCS